MTDLNDATADLAFTSSEVCRLAQVTLRQLQWWDERRVVSPSRKQRKRLYHRDDLISILVIAELRRKRLSLHSIRRVLRFLQKELDQSRMEIWDTQVCWYLLTDGKSSYLETAPENVVDRLKKERKPVLLVSLTDQVRRVGQFEKTLRAERRKKPKTAQDQLPLF